MLRLFNPLTEWQWGERPRDPISLFSLPSRPRRIRGLARTLALPVASRFSGKHTKASKHKTAGKLGIVFVSFIRFR